MPGIRTGIRRLFRLDLQREVDARADVDDEIALHIAARSEQLVSKGLDPAAARAEAERMFGDVVGAREQLAHSAVRHTGAARLHDRFDSLLSDLLYVGRSLRRSPGLTATVVVTFALGIGVNAAMFGVIDRLLLRGPQHVTRPQELARLYAVRPDPVLGERSTWIFGYITYEILKRDARAVAGVAAYRWPGEVRLGERGEEGKLRLGAATSDFFPLLGARPLLGRFFATNEDGRREEPPLLVISYDFWQRHFGGDPAAVGQQLQLNGRAYTVVGVAPEGFTGADMSAVDGWTPITRDADEKDQLSAWHVQGMQVIVRLRPGVSARAASDEARAISRRNFVGWPGEANPYATAMLTMRPISFDYTGAEPREVGVARWLAGVALVVLLIACANVANLLLARAAQRRREIAVRLALGVSRMRLMRLLLIESSVLAFTGAALALTLAWWLAQLVRTRLLPGTAFPSAPVDSRVFAFSMALAIVVGIAAGIVPALQTRSMDLGASLKSGSRQSGVARSRIPGALIFAQTALSVVLLVAAGLFVRSLVNVHRTDMGFDPARVLEAQLWDPRGNAPDPLQRAAYQRLYDRVRREPGVAHAALAVGSPFGSDFGVTMRVPGRDSLPDLGSGPFVSAVSPGYFETTGMRLRRGRWFTERDEPGSEPVVVVNETMARTLWPSRDAVGECVQVFEKPCFRVVGVVDDVHRHDFHEQHAMQYYVPLGQERGIGGLTLLARPAGDPELFRTTLERLARETEPALYSSVWLKQDAVDPLMRPWRVGSLLFGLFGGLALLIAAIGLYSVIAYMVARRTQEFGVRIALGATAARLLSQVMGRGLRVVLAGLAAGVIVSLVAGRFVEPLLFETTSRDPFVIAATTVVLLGVAACACLIPALRAARVDPIAALRED